MLVCCSNLGSVELGVNRLEAVREEKLCIFVGEVSDGTFLLQPLLNVSIKLFNTHTHNTSCTCLQLGRNEHRRRQTSRHTKVHILVSRQQNSSLRDPCDVALESCRWRTPCTEDAYICADFRQVQFRALYCIDLCTALKSEPSKINQIVEKFEELSSHP